MTKEEKKDKKIEMDSLSIPISKRSSFMRWANKFGRFNIHGDNLWYEYGPLESHQKSTRTMHTMWCLFTSNN